jgi:quercetin dioxygenase-like cupin family protein
MESVHRARRVSTGHDLPEPAPGLSTVESAEGTGHGRARSGAGTSRGELSRRGPIYLVASWNHPMKQLMERFGATCIVQVVDLRRDTSIRNIMVQAGLLLMFYRRSEGGYRAVAPGISVKTLTYGDSMLFTEFNLKANCRLPRHSHPQEQTGYLVSGSMRLMIGPEEHLVGPGDSWNIPGNMIHEAVVLEDSVAIEVFSPVREDYLPSDGKKG